MLDGATCEACRDVDGTEYATDEQRPAPEALRERADRRRRMTPRERQFRSVGDDPMPRWEPPPRDRDVDA